MSAFDDSLAIEAQAFCILRPYLLEQSDGGYVLTNKGTLSKWLQESVGDVVMNIDEQLFTIEIKAERKHTGNLFLEIWSNKNLNKRSSHGERGSNPGWMFKVRADRLFYYFMDVDILYSVDLFSLKRWAFGYGDRDNPVAGRLYQDKHKEVLTRSDQLNDTWGRLVDVKVLFKELPHRAIMQTSVVQRQLEIA